MLSSPAREHALNLIKGYNKWFWQQGDDIIKKYRYFFWFGILFGFAATITAAIPKAAISGFTESSQSLIGWLVVIFSTLSTLCNTTLVPRYRNMFEMRGKGRIRMDELLQRYEASEFEEADMKEIYTIIKEIAAIEADFGGVDKPK